MNQLENQERADQIVESFKNYEITRDVATRELQLLGLDLNEVRQALGAVQLNG